MRFRRTGAESADAFRREKWQRHQDFASHILSQEWQKLPPDDFAAVLAGLAKLRNRQYHRPPLSKSLGDGLFELRHVGKLNTRVLWFFARQRRIIAVHGIRNKGQAIPARDLSTARERMRDWQERAER